MLVLDARHEGVQRDGASLDGVDHEAHGQRAALLVGVGADHPPVTDRYGAGLDDPHRLPDACGVPAAGEVVAVLECPGERALLARVIDGRAADLDREHVGRVLVELVGYLEAVGEEVAVGVADVGTVEPDIALGEHAVEFDPCS